MYHGVQYDWLFLVYSVPIKLDSPIHNINCFFIMSPIRPLYSKKKFFSYIILWVFVYMYLCRPSEASTRYCVIPGGYPPQD
jgi:hypothetical protein